jgi:hypothetical protein
MGVSAQLAGAGDSASAGLRLWSVELGMAAGAGVLLEAALGGSGGDAELLADVGPGVTCWRASATVVGSRAVAWAMRLAITCRRTPAPPHHERRRDTPTKTPSAVKTHRHHFPVSTGAVRTHRQTLSHLTDKARQAALVRRHATCPGAVKVMWLGESDVARRVCSVRVTRRRSRFDAEMG